MQTYYTIYKTINLINNKFYIGKHQTTKLNDNYLGSGIVLNRAIQKYGKEYFIKEILFCFDNSTEMESMERKLITESLINDSLCYNIALGGQGGDLGQEINKRRGKTMSRLLKNIPKTNAHKRAISKSKAGKKQDLDAVKHRAKIIVQNCVKMTQKERNKKFGRSGATNGFYKKHHSKETILILKQKCGRAGALNGNAKPIILYGKKYGTKKECFTALGISKKKLNQILGDLK